jgi:hypothetical protein
MVAAVQSSSLACRNKWYKGVKTPPDNRCICSVSYYRELPCSKGF